MTAITWKKRLLMAVWGGVLGLSMLSAFAPKPSEACWTCDRVKPYNFVACWPASGWRDCTPQGHYCDVDGYPCTF
jgi:hypothetical protein